MNAARRTARSRSVELRALGVVSSAPAGAARLRSRALRGRSGRKRPEEPKDHAPNPSALASAAHIKQLEQLAAAIDAYRGGRQRCHLPQHLRAQVVAPIDITIRAVREACKLSGSQITRWRQAAARSSSDAGAVSAPVFESPRILSVVDRTPREGALLDGEIELRIGGWRVSLRREES